MLSTLLHRSEYWRITEADLSKLHSFQNHKSTQDLAIILAPKDNKCGLIKEMWPRIHGHHDQEEKMEMDRIGAVKGARWHR